MGTLYDTLGVKDTAKQQDIQRAYHQLARQYHPDSANGQYDADAWQKIQEAYELLSDPKKRGRYDKILGVTQRPAPSQQPSNWRQQPGNYPQSAGSAFTYGHLWSSGSSVHYAPSPQSQYWNTNPTIKISPGSAPNIAGQPIFMLDQQGNYIQIGIVNTITMTQHTLSGYTTLDIEVFVK